jgi:ankyrin repeat protein
MQLVNLKIWDPETSVDRNGCTAFLWAAGEGHLNICQLLYTHFAIDVNCMKGKAGQKRHALHWATRNGHIEVCDWLVNVLGVDVNIATEDGTTPLHFACYTGQFSMCKWLVDCVNCNVNQLNSYGCNASQWCAINGDVDIMKLMKASGLDFSVINNNGHSALHKAAIKGNFECCKWLLLSDAEGGGGLQEVHMAEDSDGFTPMLFARSNGHIELANWFVSRTENIHFEHS